MRRRTLLRSAIAAAAARVPRAGAIEYEAVVPGRAPAFPRAFGAHPAFRTEWWYVTGSLRHSGGPIGIQVTFFRHRPGVAEDNPSRFAPTQLMFAHAAIADPAMGRLRHDQRAARAGFGLAQASEQTTDVRIDDWWLRREGDVYRTHVVAREFTLELAFAVRQPPLLQGDAGYSRKGPDAGQASYYYSEPQLEATGDVVLGQRTSRVDGRAWCDHEWSSEYLPAAAAGWDWIGINFDDGGALMAFVMRRVEGGALWAAASLRDPSGRVRSFGREMVRFIPIRTWRSPRTNAVYPVALQVDVGAARYMLEPLFDDQELDARATTGTVYWEGAVRVQAAGREVGRGYLELTGYVGRLRL